MERRQFLGVSAGTLAAVAMPVRAADIETVSVRIETREVIGPLPHIWEECVGSDRAAITLRESWRQDIDRARADLGIKRVRFHGIFNDELGVKTKTWLSRSGKTNFRDVAEVYDGLVSRNLAPFVELGFTPVELSALTFACPGGAAFGLSAAAIATSVPQATTTPSIITAKFRFCI